MDTIFLEPYGHDSEMSKIERYWKNSTGPISLVRKRIVEYDPYAGMTYQPMSYVLRDFHLDFTNPPKDWIVDNLIKFIRTEFSSRQQCLPQRFFPKINKKLFFSDKNFIDFFRESEAVDAINYENKMMDSPEGMAKNIYDILCDHKIGSPKNRKNNDEDKFIEDMVPVIASKSRLLFLLPGFPFKDQNKFRSLFSADIPDIAELSFMIRLHKLTQSLYQVHPYGVDVVVLSDGDLYCDIFNVEKDCVNLYLKRLVQYRNKLNIQGTLSILSLKELIDRSGTNGEAWGVVDYISKKIESILSISSPELISLFDVLISGMKWNFNSKLILENCPDTISWKLLCCKECEIEDKYISLWRNINELATSAALKYAAVNLMLTWLDLIKYFFPGTIRGTVHPKPGQFALADSNNSFPWNGIAWSSEWPTTISDIETKSCVALSEYESVNQVFFDETLLPCFFTKSNFSRNISAARNVLCRTAWKVSNISGREFNDDDMTDFLQFGRDDPNAVWERSTMNEEYFINLFKFRKNHYKEYGFGVHGLWIDGKLCGQCGLQVLDAESDEVELVLFLKNQYTRCGYGTILTKYIIGRCALKKMEKLFVVVRKINKAGLAITNKFCCRPVKSINHFGHDAFVFEMNLQRGG